MHVPILKQGDYLIASIQTALSDSELLELRNSLVEVAGVYKTKAVFIDLTVLEIMDSFACRTLRSITQMLMLRGTQTVIVGIQPDVAFAMVQLGLSLEGILTALDLDDGISLFQGIAT